MGKSTVVKLLLILVYAAKIDTRECNIFVWPPGESCFGELRCSDYYTIQLETNEWLNCNSSETYSVRFKGELPDYKSPKDFRNLDELKFYITSIIFTNNALKSTLRLTDYGFLNATNIDISHNEINSLALSNFLPLKSLEVLNVSHNAIETLLTDKQINLKLDSLSVLDLSHNLIETVPKQYFQSIPQIVHLDLSHNSIGHFDDLTFVGLHQLKTLSVANNKLTQIGSTAQKVPVSNNDLKYIGGILQYTPALTELDLSHNNIQVILKSQFFTFVNNLTSLDLSHNNISTLEATAFEGKNITSFKVHNNRLTGLLDDNTFEGTNPEELDLSGGRITELGSDLFVGQNLRLKVLNFSNNLISEIKQSSFHNVRLLTELDLSNNKLQSINFDMRDIGKLTHFYAKNNLIQQITKDKFNNLVSLRLIDLSYNQIKTFLVNDENMKDVIEINLSNNKLEYISNNTFLGLTSLQILKLDCNKIVSIQPGSFSTTRSIRFLNLNNNNLRLLRYGIFDVMEDLENLNLSRNALIGIPSHLFYLNRQLKSLALDDNFISHLDCDEIRVSTIKKLTLGGNLFTCALILKCMRELSDIVITAENKNFHAENIQGITCNREIKNIIKTRLIDTTTVSNNKTANGDITIHNNETANAIRTTSVDSNIDANDKIASRDVTIQFDFGHTISKNLSDLKSAINVGVVCLVVLACLLVSILTLILFYSYKKHRFTNEYHVNRSDMLLTNMRGMEL